MKKYIVAASLLFAGMLLLTGAKSAAIKNAPAPASSVSGNAAHGEYLVMHVAMCVQCHSPRDEQGNLLEGKLLTGAPMPVHSPWRNNPFAYHTPNLHGFNAYTQAEAIRLLTTGLNRRGKYEEPPMPPFRMTRQDAEDIYAYLVSLN